MPIFSPTAGLYQGGIEFRLTPVPAPNPDKPLVHTPCATVACTRQVVSPSRPHPPPLSPEWSPHIMRHPNPESGRMLGATHTLEPSNVRCHAIPGRGTGFAAPGFSAHSSSRGFHVARVSRAQRRDTLRASFPRAYLCFSITLLSRMEMSDPTGYEP